jgi:hypothetical protein
MFALSRRAEPLPADTEARIGEFTELVATAISNIQARSELAASRARIVAATDAERRRVVRDLHDGAQQRLIHTILTLKLASDALQKEEDDGPALVTEALDHAQQATSELRELAHGILPGVLTHGGLRAGVEALASRMPVPVENGVAVGRLPAAVESTAYFVVSEALTNVAKHACAKHAEVTARIEDGTLAVQVRDDGVGGARPDGSGLVGLADRLAALDGQLRVETPAHGGTVIAAAIPLAGSAPELEREAKAPGGQARRGDHRRPVVIPRVPVGASAPRRCACRADGAPRRERELHRLTAGTRQGYHCQRFDVRDAEGDSASGSRRSEPDCCLGPSNART